jgi:hypothetical protein
MTAPTTPTRLGEIESRLETLRAHTHLDTVTADLAALLVFAKAVRAAIRNPFGNAQADVTDITAALDRLEAS